MPPVSLTAAVEPFLSPVGLALAYAWCFAVLASIQLTVRLIMAFSIRRTALGALALTAVVVPLTAFYAAFFRHSLDALPVAMVATGAAGYLIAARVLRLRRRRGRVAAAVGIGLLCAPWGAFLVRPG